MKAASRCWFQAIGLVKLLAGVCPRYRRTYMFCGKEVSEYVPPRTSTVYDTSGSNISVDHGPSDLLPRQLSWILRFIVENYVIISVLGTFVHVATYLQLSQ